MNGHVADRRERLDRSDKVFLAACVAIFAISLAFGVTYFDRAFPEASIQFDVDARSSETRATEFL